MEKTYPDSGSVEIALPSTYVAEVYARGFQGDRLLWRGSYASKYGAWAMARWMALLWDIRTAGEYFGIGWGVRWGVPPLDNSDLDALYARVGTHLNKG